MAKRRGLPILILILFIAMIIYSIYLAVQVILYGLPNVSIGGTPLTTNNTVTSPLIREKYYGLVFTTIVFILLQLLALRSMIRHKLFSYTLFAAPGILGYLTSLVYTPSPQDKIAAAIILVIYMLGFIYTVKREWRIKGQVKGIVS
ncbi:MAG: hypothetical protein GXO43_00600 [Crenarchaeota archaeon]|nr:hypothetical protein [Thermoproteota archaeon]